MVSTRATTSDPWSTPVYLGAIVNSPFIDGAPFLSFDETALYFQSTRNSSDATGPCLPNLGPCLFDFYVTTRAKLREPDDKRRDSLFPCPTRTRPRRRLTSGWTPTKIRIVMKAVAWLLRRSSRVNHNA
jgi:hypothetical protein